MEIDVKISLFSHISSLFFWFFDHDFITYIDLPMLQLQTLRLMTSQIRSHVEYLIQTYNILFLILYSKLIRNVATLTVFNTI